MSDKPKALVDIGGEPLLARHLRSLERAGLDAAVINAHWLAEQIEDFAREYKGPLRLTVLREETILGTAGGVRNALDAIGGTPIVVLYGDVMVDAPVGEMLSAHRAAGAAATLAVYDTDETEGKGTVDVDEADRVTAFREKQDHGGARRLVNAGVYVIEAGLVAPLPAGEELDFGHDVFPAALSRGDDLRIFRLPDPVIDIGTPDGLEAARAAAAPRP